MLKAVCLDEKAHKHLIQFIINYRDESGRQNISSAIRFLMLKGYESLYGNPSKTIEEDNQKEEIKKEVVNEVMGALNTKILDNLTEAIDKLSNIQHIPVIQQSDSSHLSNSLSSLSSLPANTNQQSKQSNQGTYPKAEKPVVLKKPAKSIGSNSLLSNLLGNANR